MSQPKRTRKKPGQPNKKISIVEVAERAGVSIATVSRVINNGPHPVSEETRQRVLKAARDLHYSPNALARAMVGRSTYIIGVIVSDSADPYFAPIVRGVEEIARTYGYLVIVANSNRQVDIELKYIQTLEAYQVDGLIFSGGGPTDPAYLAQVLPLLAQIDARGAAVIAVGREGLPYINIPIDNEGVGQAAAEHLISLGHRRIAYIAGPEKVTTTSQRLAGYRAALDAHNIPFDPSLVLHGDYTFESGQEAAVQLLDMPELPTAVLGSNDLMAIGCSVALQAGGYRVPSDISVMGMGNITPSGYVEPALSTVSVPLYELGGIAMDCLIQHREGKLSMDQLPVLPFQLIERQSTGPARAQAGE